MKRYNTFYYLLFILLITGAFASMAQNSYGLKMMGGVAFGFGLVFLIELVFTFISPEKKDTFVLVELLCLDILSFIFALRIFNMRFPLIEIWFAAAGVGLAMLFLWKLLPRFRLLKGQNKYLAMLSLVFHLSIILFLISLVLFPFKPKVGEGAGIIACALMFVLIIAGFLKRKIMVDGENVNAFTMIKRFNDHSVIIVSLFLLFTLYVGFNRVGVLPGIYSDEYPQAYYDLVNKASSGKEEPVDGKNKYEIFKEQYDQFLIHHSIKE